MPTIAELIDALSRPRAYAHAVEAVDVLQTHASVLFLAGDRVYKVKKPVDLGFLDFTTLERRRRACADEVRLNRRLAPSVYLGVVPVTAGPEGLRVGGDGDPLEWAVEMVRLPAERMLDRLLEGGGVTDEQLAGLVSLLARFHREAPTGPGVDEHGTPEAVAFNVRENFDQTEGFVAGERAPAPAGPRVFTPALHAFLRAEADRFLAEENLLLRRRVLDGRVRDGHGDLHAGNVCFLDEGIVVYDCIEFSDRLRCGDVACDLAFLTMDLDARGFRRLGSWMAAGYAREAADTELERLLPFYSAYRAMVRAKVAAIAATEAELTAGTREAERREAIRYAALAAGYHLQPSLVLTCGLPGTGKTTIATIVATALGAEHLRSDVVRKELAGLGPTDRIDAGFEEGIYSPEMTERTHASLHASVELALGSGRSVVVDATSATAGRRFPFRDIADRLQAPFVLVETVAPPEVVEERLRRRAAEEADASDAGVAIYRAMRERYEPPVEIEPGSLVQLGAGEPPEEGLLRIVDRLVAPALTGRGQASRA